MQTDDYWDQWSRNVRARLQDDGAVLYLQARSACEKGDFALAARLQVAAFSTSLFERFARHTTAATVVEATTQYAEELRRVFPLEDVNPRRFMQAVYGIERALTTRRPNQNA